MPSGVKDIQLLELKDTISQLNKTISTQNELISSLQKMLEERNAKDSEKDLLIANLQSQLAYLKNKVFGSTSEIRHDQLDGQLNLFGTPVGDEKPAEVIEPEVISVKGYTKERKPKATYDGKYNSVRSICKHFFTDIVGLSIKFFCVSLRHMSIPCGNVVGRIPSAGGHHRHPLLGNDLCHFRSGGIHEHQVDAKRPVGLGAADFNLLAQLLSGPERAGGNDAQGAGIGASGSKFAGGNVGHAALNDGKFCPQKLIQSIHTGLLFSNSSMTPPQVRPPPNPTATTRLPGPIRPRSCSSLKARGMLAAEVFP